jgi:hypothetical protein
VRFFLVTSLLLLIACGGGLGIAEGSSCENLLPLGQNGLIDACSRDVVYYCCHPGGAPIARPCDGQWHELMACSNGCARDASGAVLAMCN